MKLTVREELLNQNTTMKKKTTIKQEKEEFSLGLGSVNPLSVDPCNVRGKTFKLIRGEAMEEKTAVVDAETQKTVAVLRRELQREKLRSFKDLTKQRAKIVTVVAGAGGNSTTTETNEPPKHLKQHPVATTVTNSSRMVELPVKNKTKNSFEIAFAKIEKNHEIFQGRILLS